MNWTWEILRAQYQRKLEAAKAAAKAKGQRLTQEQIAAAGGLLGKKGNYVSKIKTTRMQYGLGTELFIRLIAGLGIPVSDFFAELEGHRPHLREHHDYSGMAPVSELERDLDRIAIVNTLIETLQRGVAAPARTALRRRRKKH